MEISGDNLREAAKDAGLVAGILATVYAGLTWLVPYVRRFYRMQAILADIEKQFGAQAALVLKAAMVRGEKQGVQTASRLDAMCDAQNLAMYECSSAGLCTWVSEPLATMFGLSRADMLGDGWLKSILHREDVYHAWTFSVHNRIPYDARYSVVNQITKVERRAETSAKAVLSTGGEVLCYIGIVKLL